jgi:uncharacterized protein (DUF305 family)
VLRSTVGAGVVRRSTCALAALVLGGLLLTACGDDQDGTGSQTGDSSSTDHNDADVAFASDMIQHHAQALAMVDLTVQRDLDPEVQALAETIRAAQAPEIETMSDWLTQWGEPIPATVRDHVNAEDEHGGEHEDGMEDDTGMDMPGMMSDEEMDQLEGAGDAEFQSLFLEMMIEHHEGAIEMARTEQEDGRYPPAVTLAEQIEAAQAAEVETMEALVSQGAPG